MDITETRFPTKEGIAVAPSSHINGQFGVIATKEYPKGSVIFRVEGPLVSKPTRYSFAVDIGKNIEPERPDGIADFGHYVNHSCDPTVIVRPVVTPEIAYIEVIARNDITTGEEITFDYATLEYDVTVANSPCLCGSVLCRGVIHGFKDLPADVKEKYRAEGIIAEYLLRLEKTT